MIDSDKDRAPTGARLVDCRRCRGTGASQLDQPVAGDRPACSACEGAGKMPLRGFTAWYWSVSLRRMLTKQIRATDQQAALASARLIRNWPRGAARLVRLAPQRFG